MIDMRGEPKSQVAQQELVKQLIKFAKSIAGYTLLGTIEIINKAA
jgi:hypothetical protein